MRHADIRATMNVYGKPMDESKRAAARSSASYGLRRWLNAQCSTLSFGRCTARFSPLNLLLLKTGIPATAPCVHGMDTLICKLAGAVGIETEYHWHSNDLPSLAAARLPRL